MLKHIYLILIATFILGFLAGVLLYLQSSTGKEGDGALETETKGVTITVDIYGGCSRIGCPSYRIANNGSYIYLARDSEGRVVRRSDTLPLSERAKLWDLVDTADFEAIGATQFTGTCPITFDGVAFQYVIEKEGVQYRFDSCVEDLEGEPLFETLAGYFEQFAEPSSVR